MLRVRPLLGRTFLDSDDGAGSPNLIVLGFNLWQRRFGSRNDIVGQIVRLDGQPFTVIGVMPEGFAFPNPETEAWTRLDCGARERAKRHAQTDDVLGHRPPAPRSDARAGRSRGDSAARSAPDLKETAVALFGNNGPAGMTALPARDVMTAEVRPALLILFAAVVLLFLTSTASLVVLQLSRVARSSP